MNIYFYLKQQSELKQFVCIANQLIFIVNYIIKSFLLHVRLCIEMYDKYMMPKVTFEIAF